MIRRLPSTSAWHDCDEPERCAALHDIDLSSVRAVIQSGLRRSHVCGWTFGGLSVHTLRWRDGDQIVTVRFGSTPSLDGTFKMPDWNRIEHIDVQPVGAED